VEDQALYLVALSMIKGLGPVSIKNLIAYCGSPEAVLTAPKTKLMRAPGVGDHVAELVKQADTAKLAAEEVKLCEKNGVEIVSYMSPAYPHLLTYIYNAPLILFKKGNINLNAQPNIAIVGTRKPTEQGRIIAEEFATYFAEKGINVVSGLAYGIDLMAHKGALAAKAKTTAVLGHGLDQIYPRYHADCAYAMLECGGLLTEYVIGTKPDPAHFPARNRIVAGMCKAVIVIEAAHRGGALITAQMAFEQNREVYAIPGRLSDTRSTGCNQLIRDQIAKLVTHPQEVLDDLEIQWDDKLSTSSAEQTTLDFSPIHLSSEETKVMNLLNRQDAVIDHISTQTGIPMRQLSPLLLTMEFKGLIIQAPGKKFSKR